MAPTLPLFVFKGKGVYYSVVVGNIMETTNHRETVYYYRNQIKAISQTLRDAGIKCKAEPAPQKT
jgi:hypothetical protein